MPRASLVLVAVVGGCARTVEVGLSFCDEVDAYADESGVLDCDDLPALCGLPVTSEPDPGGDAIDLVFVEVGGLRSSDFVGHVDRVMADRRRDVASIIGRDPTLFRAHIVEVPEPGWFGDDVLPACASGAGLRSGVSADFSSPRVQLAAANAPVPADIIVAVHPETAFAIRETARGNIMAVTFNRQGTAFDHELGHALIGLGDEYTEFDACCADDDAGFEVVVGDAGITGFPNVVRDLAATTFDGLAPGVVEGANRCTRCAFHADASCAMGLVATEVTWCPICERAIEARLADFAPDRHVDELPPRCKLLLDRTPTRGVNLEGRVVVEPGTTFEVSLVVRRGDVREHPLDASFILLASDTAGATSAEITLRCSDGDDSAVHRLVLD